MTGFSFTAYGVLGSSRDTVGVRGDSTNSSALYGRSSNGYGGEFSGGKAQARLVPHTSHLGKPTSGTHRRGELFADAAGALWYCTHDSSSLYPAGQWKKVSLV